MRTQGFARDVQAMRAELDGPLAGGAARAGQALETVSQLGTHAVWRAATISFE